MYQLEHHVPARNERDRNQILAMQQFLHNPAADGWKWDDFEALRDLWQRESGWDATAANPNSSAFGIPQALTRLHKLDDSYRNSPERQIDWGFNYIRNRYGRPRAALDKWLWRAENDHRGGWY